MKKFIFKIIVFTVIIFITLKFVDVVVSKGLRKNKTKLFSTITKVYQGKINSDLIINGSSKAFVQVDPQIIDSVINIRSYNLGLDGSPFIPQKALFDLYRQHNKKPKVIVQIVSNGTLRSLDAGFRNPIKFSPYLEIPEIKKLMKLTGSFSYLDFKIPMLRYSGSPFEITTGVLSLFNINIFKHIDNQGYSPNNKYWPDNSNENIEASLETIQESTFINSQKVNEFTTLDSVSCKLFENFLDNCFADDIFVFLVYPPIYANDSNTIKNIDYYKLVAKKYNACFLDYSRDSTLVHNKDYFYNSQHLNVEGATKFTNKLAIDIKTRTHNNVYTK